MVEQLAVNELVAGSNPALGAHNAERPKTGRFGFDCPEEADEKQGAGRRNERSKSGPRS